MAANPATQASSYSSQAMASPPGEPIVRRTEDRPNLLLRTLQNLRRSEFFGNAFLRVFRACQAVGVTVLPNHYYWPIPDIRKLEQQPWKNHALAFDLNMAGQKSFALDIVSRYTNELNFPEVPGDDITRYHRNNGFFETVDADIAYCMVREYKPQRIIEIGGGSSTRVMAQAVRVNAEKHGVACQFTTIEPYPDAALQKGIPGHTRLIPTTVQDAPRSLFDTLEAGDILFIDSSHVVTVGSDVVVELLEIVPRLRKGVLVHVHDIFTPAEYPREAVLNNLWFWAEQYMLEALLTSNREFKVLFGCSAMAVLEPQILEQTFPGWATSYARMPARTRRFLPTPDRKRVWPSSFWMLKTE